MSDTQAATDKQIAEDVSRNPNEREAARARLIHAAAAAKAAKSEEPKHE